MLGASADRAAATVPTMTGHEEAAVAPAVPGFPASGATTARRTGAPSPPRSWRRRWCAGSCHLGQGHHEDGEEEVAGEQAGEDTPRTTHR